MADIKRRDVLRYGAAGAVTASTALFAAQSLASAEPSAPEAAAPPPPDPRDFLKTYRGKRIRGKYIKRGSDEVYINDKKLAITLIQTLFPATATTPEHVGYGYISALNHYDPVEIDETRYKDGLQLLAQKVCDILGDLDISPAAGQAHYH
ncbi:tyrosinase family oxidase copper chaperone [Actinoplanes sp. NPDC051861]|uniref:tyrosinase family oxidase copper chaperone n=1 Tax=Actinoplanes sp. NPDC051861 TaxID=3155170 RepID=UPI003447529B